ncbi:MAG: hypothetical protein NT167_07375 [Verrucomicrobia bacterium]|nr:hypothetical protein [Verrucomicrobiota bacterium]
MTDPGFGKQEVWIKKNNGSTNELLGSFDTDKAAMLKALVKNSDRQVTPDEIRPLAGAGRGCGWGQNQSQ